MPYNKLIVGGGVPVIPAASTVTVIEFEVGVPETIGTVGGWFGAVPEPVPVVIAPETALVWLPAELVATDWK